MSDIRSIKLVSGEELICKVKSEDEKEIVAEDVLGLMATQTANGMQISLVPFMLSNPKGDLRIQRNAITIETTPSSELEKGYIERTTSIVLAK